MELKDYYVQLLEKKRAWQPTFGGYTPVIEGAENTIGRCLGLRTLEISVGDWISDGCLKERDKLGEEAIALLMSNVEDEVKHDRALNLATAACNLTTSGMEEEANDLAEQWRNHPDHPIVKAFVLENGVFFVLLPILRMLGNPGLKNLSADISSDESVHAASHRMVSNQLGLSYSPSLDALRRRTVAWMVSDLDAPGKYGYPEIWLQSSEQLLRSGRSPNLEQTKAYGVPAFFETHASNLSIYA